MFTANLAGTSGSHLRHDHHHHGHPPHMAPHVSHSRLNLHDGDSDEDSKHNFNSPFIQGGSDLVDGGSSSNGSNAANANGGAGGGDDAEGGGSGSGGDGKRLSRFRMMSSGVGAASAEKCDLKTVVMLSCFAFIVISGIVLIIMAAMGHFNDNRR